MAHSEPSRSETPIILSVIIPCFNHGEYILEAISSVQSCQESIYEIVIVNDGSTDPLTQKVLNYLRENGCRIIDQENQGLAASRNRGIEKANGRYILPLDADNKIRPDYITKAVDILDKSPTVGVVYGNAQWFGEETKILEVPEFDINRIVMGNYIDACAVFRKVVWEECGGYDPKIPERLGYEDWDFWLSAAEKGWKFYHIPEVLFDYRVRSDSMVSRCNVPENRKQLFRYICTKHIGLYATNFANVYAEKEYEFLTKKYLAESLEIQLRETEAELERWKTQFQQTQAELYQSQSKLEKTKDELEDLQSQLLHVQFSQKQTHSALEQTHVELARIHAAHDRTCLELAQLHEKHKQTCEELAQLHAAHDGTCAELTQAYRLLEQTHAVLDGTKAEVEYEKAELLRSRAREEQTRQVVEQLRELIAAMQNTKFWKLRTSWFKIKKMLGLASDDV